MRNLKHFFIFRDFPPQKGGMSIYYYNLVKFIKGDKKVFVPKDSAYPPFIENTRYIIAPFEKGKEKNFFLTLLWVFQIIYNMLFEKPDFLHIGKIRPITYFILIFKIFKPKIVLYFHGLDYYELKNKSYIKRKLVNYAIKKSDLVVCANRYVREIIKKSVELKKSYILYPGIDIEYFTKIDKKLKKEKKDKFVILTVGNLVKRKGMDTVLKSLALLKDEFKFKYYIIGKGPEDKNLKELCKKLNLKDKVEFLGEIGEEKFKYYKNADIFVMPSRVVEEEGSFEGFGIVFLEAGFFKKLLIGAKTGGIPEAIENGKTGILLEDPEDYHKLSEIIKSYFNSPEKFNEIQENAYKRTISSFNVRKLIEDFEKNLLSLKNESSSH